jgi:hypothetical protein
MMLLARGGIGGTPANDVKHHTRGPADMPIVALLLLVVCSLDKQSSWGKAQVVGYVLPYGISCALVLQATACLPQCDGREH